MEIYYSFNGGCLDLSLVGELDEFCAERAKQQLDKIITENKPNSIVYDMSRLAFMDSTGIGVLIGRYKLAKSMGCTCAVKNVSRVVDKIFVMSGLYQIMPKIS